MPRATGYSPSSAGAPRPSCAVVPEASALPVPDELPWDEAGGFPEVFCTAHDALFTQAGLLAGERVLVSGAAGGVGTAAVQLAKAAGAHVVASVRNRDHHRAVADFGAAEVVVPDRGPGPRPLRRLSRAGGCPRGRRRCCPHWPSAPASWSSGSAGAAPCSSSTCWR